MMMKKSPCALPGVPRAMEMAPSLWVRPVFVVGSCGIGGSMRLGSDLAPPWIRPSVPG